MLRGRTRRFPRIALLAGQLPLPDPRPLPTLSHRSRHQWPPTRPTTTPRLWARELNFSKEAHIALSSIHRRSDALHLTHSLPHPPYHYLLVCTSTYHSRTHRSIPPSILHISAVRLQPNVLANPLSICMLMSVCVRMVCMSSRYHVSRFVCLH